VAGITILKPVRAPVSDMYTGKRERPRCLCGDPETVRELVLETGMNPIRRCNAARADFDLRADAEAGE